MNPTDVTYPVFEANQVLTNAHLNDLFDYLDEQTRLTRSNLIGIGIVCGLEVAFEAPGTVRLTHGCGIPSEGYLIVEPADLALSHVRPYQVPKPDYPPFMKAGSAPPFQFDLWELVPDDDEPGAVPLATSGIVLEDKAVVLFLELRTDDLRNCSPNNCDDRGNEVTATVRRLLIDVADLDLIIAATRGAAALDLGADLTERLALPDLRMPRVDVPNSAPVAPEAVLSAFQAAFRRNTLAATTGQALAALYAAFRPIVAEDFPSDPFTGFAGRFGFLDGTPRTTVEVRFMQYYWDFFDDLVAAYDEVRWKGVDLMCACCPAADLFPRHLMAGVLDPVAHDPADYRHAFLPSPAVGDCEDRTRELRQLFRRLVAMIEAFTETPPDLGIRATPSRWGDAPVSTKAIPYYYDQDDDPPVFELWDPVRTSRRRANQNLGYRAADFTPSPPAFVTEPLRYDLEPSNFLRIEGHLGKNVQNVLETLLQLRKSHRLPFSVVALRTGAFDESVEVDLKDRECRFQDLETLYDTLRSEMTCFLAKQVEYFYELRSEGDPGEGTRDPSLELLRRHSPRFKAKPGTLGLKIEGLLTREEGERVEPAFTLTGTGNLPAQVLALVAAMSNLSTRLTDDFADLDLRAFGAAYRRLVTIARETDDLRRQGAFDAPGLSDRLDDIVFRCRLDPLEALATEYRRRVREVKQAQFLAHFLERHPGVQHKAGVPLGGTFILVYHDLPAPAAPPVLAAPPESVLESDVVPGSFQDRPEPTGLPFLDLNAESSRPVREAVTRMSRKSVVADDPDVQILVRATTGTILVAAPAPSSASEQVYADAVSKLPPGTVIADFFLPYQCCSDCTPIEFRLPSTRLRLTAGVACTRPEGFAEVTLTTEGATGSVSVQVDGGAFTTLTGRVPLGVGDHTVVVRDSTGNESSPLTVAIPPPLAIGTAKVTVDDTAGTYRVVATITGGRPPYTVDHGTVVDTTYTSPATPVADVLTVVVTDAAACAVDGRFESGAKPCTLPCDGRAEKRGHRFWLPEARPKLPVNAYTATVRAFTVTDPDGNTIDLTSKVDAIVSKAPDPIPAAQFDQVVDRWMDAINTVIASAVGSDQWLRLEYVGAPKTGTTGSLFIDRISCIRFEFALSVGYTQGRKEHALEFAYDSAGTVVAAADGRSKFRVPPFDGSTSNKCRPGDPSVPVCGAVDLQLTIERAGIAPDMVVLKAAPTGSDVPTDFLWELQDGEPSVGAGQGIQVRFDALDTPRKRVRLTAFTARGCTVTVDRLIDVTSAD